MQEFPASLVAWIQEFLDNIWLYGKYLLFVSKHTSTQRHLCDKWCISSLYSLTDHSEIIFTNLLIFEWIPLFYFVRRVLKALSQHKIVCKLPAD